MSARKTGTTLATLVLLGGMAAALLLPQALFAQGGLILAEGLAPTKLFRIDLVSPGVNEARFLLDMVHADIVHAITICPGDDRVLGIGADIPAISIVDLGQPVPTDVLVVFLPDENEPGVSAQGTCVACHSTEEMIELVAKPLPPP